MKFFKLIIISSIILSVGFADHRGRHKAKRYKKHHIQRVTYPRWAFGMNWHSHWDHSFTSRKVIVVKEESNNETQKSVLQLIEEIEKLAELKEKGLITDKDYEIAKKELLKQI